MTTANAAKKIPSSSQSHGNTLVTVSVGPDAVKFFIHKGLISNASPYFSTALSGKFADGGDDTLMLTDHCPCAFEVAYQYMYSGEVFATEEYVDASTMPADAFWLRVFKLADATMMRALQLTAYDRLRIIHSSKDRTVPSLRFLRELYDLEYPQVELQKYVVRHCAFWSYANHDYPSDLWKIPFEHNPSFAADVAYRLTALLSNHYKYRKTHPDCLKSFEKNVLFPEQVAKSKVEAVTKKEEQSHNA